MHKRILVLLAILAMASSVYAADCTVSLTWDGKDALGKVEASLPVTFTVYDADTLDVLTSAQVNGAVAGYALPPFSYQAPDNQTITLRIQATAKDSKGNESPPSQVVSAIIKGQDTAGPLSPQITITIGD